MKNFKYTIFGFIFSLLTINSSMTIENKILFKVNNEIITSLDIFNELRYLETINEEFKKTEKNQAFEIAKRSLIREKIKEIELKKVIEEIKIEDQYLMNVLIKYFNQIQIETINDFEEYFIAINIDPELIKKKVSIEVFWNELILSKYKKNVKIDREAIANNLKKNNKQKEFFLSEILFNINSDEKLDEKYEKINDNIKKTNFSEAALTYSISDTSINGGELGWISESSISKKIKDSLQNINIGDHSKPIIIPGGFLILKIIDIRETNNNLNLNEEIKKIIKKKTNDQLNQFSNIFFNKIQKNVIINEL